MGVGAAAGSRAGDFGMPLLLCFSGAGPRERRSGGPIALEGNRPQPEERQGPAPAGQPPAESGAARDGARYPDPRRPVSRDGGRGKSGPCPRLPQPEAGFGGPGSRIAGPLRPARPVFRSELLPKPLTQPIPGTSPLGVVYP